MERIKLKITCHKFNIDPLDWPKQHWRRPLNAERYEVLRKEMENLHRIGFIKELIYPKWDTNVILVEKSNGYWRVCIDFTNLQSLSNDSFQLPRIYQTVDAIVGHELLSFMDTYFGHNKSPFGLKNTGNIPKTHKLHVHLVDRQDYGGLC